MAEVGPVDPISARALTMKAPATERRFAEFVRAHTASLFRTAYLVDQADYDHAEDVLQAALVRVSQHWPRVDGHGPARAAYARKVVVEQEFGVVVEETFLPRVAL